MTLNFRLIGRKIKEIRVMRHISQAELAELIEKSVPFISHIETATRRPSLTTLVQIANSLDVTVDAFLIGNQRNESTDYCSDWALLVADCNSDERRFIYEMAIAAKRSLRENCWLQSEKL